MSRGGRDRLDEDGPKRAVPVLEVGALAVAIAGAATAWSQTFGWRPLLLPIALAVLVPAVLALLLARRPAALSLGATLVAFPIAAVGVLAAAGSAALASDLLDGLQRGWGEVLSTTVPVTGAPALLVVPLALTWLASLVGAEVVVRTRRILAPLAAPVALLIVARLYAPSGASTASLGAAAVIAGGVLLVAARHGRLGSASLTEIDGDADAPAVGARSGLHADDTDARRLARRRSIIALPLAFLAVLLGVLAGPRLIPASTRPAASLRDARAPDLRSARERDPLDELNGTLAQAPATRLFTATMRAGAEIAGRPVAAGDPVGSGTRWLLLTLDTFDGTSWTSSSRFTRAGTTLPAGPPVTAPTTEVTQTITIDALTGTWLPALARPVEARSVDGRTRLTVDAGSGTLATDTETPGAGTRYEVTSLVPSPGGAELAAARLPAGATFAPFVSLPVGIPKEITEATRTAMASAHTPFEQVAALERYLQTNGFTYDPEALTGHSMGDLARFLSDQPGRKDTRRGTAEQFATAFTVMARTRGLPARLAVGFRPGADATWRADGDNVSVDITRGATDIWPEVYFDGLGWVAFDPVPTNGGTSSRPELEPEEVAATKSRAADAATSPDAPPAPPASNPILSADNPETAAQARPWLTVLIVVGGLVGLAVLWFAGSRFARRVVRRRRRASRHGAADPAARILGAWHEAVEHLDHQGGFVLTPPDRPAPAGHLASATVTEVGDAVARRHGDAVAEPVRALGRIVNLSTFEPEPPPAAEADRAWTLESEIRRSITRKTPVVADTPAPTPVPQPVA